MTTWIDLEGIRPSEISQTEKDKHYMVLFICGNLKKKVTVLETESKKVVARGCGKEERKSWYPMSTKFQLYKLNTFGDQLQTYIVPIQHCAYF